ncbi:MAG: transcriptional regulator, TetR family [Solirubrobacterales bacterium]|nr:transcriptional regulator, TetR family [Solirubrobacterales bacterium]
MDDLPPAPRRGRPAERPPRRLPLDRERILDAAMDLLDRRGLNAVTMRAVGEALDTGGASLYAHFANKDALVEGLLDRVYEEVPLPERGDPARWQEQVKDIVRAIRGTLVAHRDIARASLGTVPTSPQALRITDKLIEVLRAGGLSDQTVAYGIDLLALYATSVAYEESLYIKDGLTQEQFDAWRADMTHFMASLPVDRFPHVVAIAGPLTAGSYEGDERFVFGLDVILAGLAAQRS